MSRVLGWFSCGAASAVAIKLALARYPKIHLAYTRVVEEHPDNMRFLADCEQWYGQPITVMVNSTYNGSIYDVFAKTGYLKGPKGAACTRLLKKEVRRQFERPDDTHIFGYTVEEQDRFDRFLDANPNTSVVAPLIDHGLSKQDCLAILNKSGIDIPAMYKLGYQNNNCIGCVKGSAGYWNKIRVDFPDVFARMSEVETTLGRTILRVSKKGKLGPVPLRDLDPSVGKYDPMEDMECGVTCELVEKQLNSS